MTSLLRFIRFEHWFTQKLSPLLVVGYALLWATDVSPHDALAVLPVVLLCICSVAAYGHLVNDWFDIESDALSGKPNTLDGISPGGRTALIAIFVISGFGLLLLIPGPSTLVWLLIADYLLPTIYSVPPVRLKNRGALGVLSDVLAAHLIPTLFVVVALGAVTGESSSASTALIVSACAWSSCLGLRGILIHQAIDRNADRVAGLRTIATVRSRQDIRSVVVRVIVPVEAIGVGVFLASLPTYSVPVIAVLIVFVAGEVARLTRRLKMPMVYVNEVGRERYVPMVSNELYEVWLPLALALQLAVKDPLYLPLIPMHLLLFRAPILRTATMLARSATGTFRRLA